MKSWLVIAVLGLVWSSTARADDTAEVEAAANVRQSDTASERDPVAGADPWSVASATALFSRPTLSQAFKLSNDTDENGESTYSVTGGLGYFVRDDKYLDGLQVVASLDTTTYVGTFGVKYSLDFRDIRWAPRSIYASQPDLSSTACRNATSIPECSNAINKEADEAIKRYRDDWRRVALSLAVAGGWDFDDSVGGDLSVTLAAESHVGPLGVTLNGDLKNAVPDVTAMQTSRSTSTGGGLELSINGTLPKPKLPVEFGLGGKYLACLSGCGTGTSSFTFGAEIYAQIAPDVMVGPSI